MNRNENILLRKKEVRQIRFKYRQYIVVVVKLSIRTFERPTEYKIGVIIVPEVHENVSVDQTI